MTSVTEIRAIIAEARALIEIPLEERDPAIEEDFERRKDELVARLERDGRMDG